MTHNNYELPRLTFLYSLLAALFVGSEVAIAQLKPCSAFVNVTVAPMDREQLLLHQTVLVRNGRVEQIKSARDSQAAAPL
jgi:hypothetical protein